MIDQAEVEAWAARFGVSPEQILRDHLISHVLRVIADDPIGRDVIFFGGTSLCRTRLREWRVSEDIDLWAELSVASRLDPLVREKLEQEHPVAAFERTGRGTWRLTTEQRIELQIQVVDYGTEYEKCVPVASTEVDLRYSDLPRTVRMRVPTAPGFVAMKYLALVDRSAPRDLLDLWGLAEAGHLDAESIDVIRCIRRWEPKDFELARAADKARRGWIGDLAHQMASVPDFEAVVDGLRRVLSIAAGWSPSPDSDQESRSDR